MTAAELARIVRVTIKEADRGVFVATSPNLQGLLVVSKDVKLLADKLVPEAIADLYAASNQPVVLARVQEDEENPEVLPWVAVPADVARKALEASKA